MYNTNGLTRQVNVVILYVLLYVSFIHFLKTDKQSKNFVLRLAECEDMSIASDFNNNKVTCICSYLSQNSKTRNLKKAICM